MLLFILYLARNRSKRYKIPPGGTWIPNEFCHSCSAIEGQKGLGLYFFLLLSWLFRVSFKNARLFKIFNQLYNNRLWEFCLTRFNQKRIILAIRKKTDLFHFRNWILENKLDGTFFFPFSFFDSFFLQLPRISCKSQEDFLQGFSKVFQVDSFLNGPQTPQRSKQALLF